MAIFVNQQFLPYRGFPRPLAMAIFPNQRFLPSKGVFHDDAEAEAFMEKVSRECAALVLDDELNTSTIFKSTATNGLISGKTTSTAGGNGYEVVKSLTASNISGLKEPWQYELEDHHVNRCKETRALFPRDTAIAMIGKPKSNPIKDIAALTQPDPNYNYEMMIGKDKKETIFMEDEVVEDEDGVLYIQISDDIRLPVEWPYEKYP